jgi:hypothetical protein
VGEGLGFDALAQRGEVGGFLQGRGQDKLGVGGVAEQPGLRRADASVAFGLFCDRFGQGPGGQGGAARGTAGGDRQVTGAVGGEQQRKQPAQCEQREDRRG